MFFRDNQQHPLPHVHAEYQGEVGVFAIADGALLDGSLPATKRKLVGVSHQGARVMRRIAEVRANDDWTLDVVFSDGEERCFDLNPWLSDEAFEELSDLQSFKRLENHGYFIEWESGTDLSADTIFHLGTPRPRVEA